MSGMSPLPMAAVAEELDFSEAIRAVGEGKRITRLAWDDETTCVFLYANHLHLRRADGSLHTWIVSEDDVSATDWVVVREV